jgi:hypothetical protein
MASPNSASQAVGKGAIADKISGNRDSDAHPKRILIDSTRSMILSSEPIALHAIPSEIFQPWIVVPASELELPYWLAATVTAARG